MGLLSFDIFATIEPAKPPTHPQRRSTRFIQKSQNTYLDGDSHLDSDWSGSFYNRLPLVGADNVVNPASDNRCNTDPDAEANQQRLLIAGHDAAGSG